MENSNPTPPLIHSSLNIAMCIIVAKFKTDQTKMTFQRPSHRHPDTSRLTSLAVEVTKRVIFYAENTASLSTNTSSLWLSS